jgi:pyridoxine 5-phosphate synthase
MAMETPKSWSLWILLPLRPVEGVGSLKMRFDFIWLTDFFISWVFATSLPPSGPSCAGVKNGCLERLYHDDGVWKADGFVMRSNVKLGVNIDHVATLRQARYRSGTAGRVPAWAEPDLSFAVEAVQKAGAHGITFHLREDRRHIQDDDLKVIKEISDLPLNMEMAANDEILDIALRLKPHEVCLVPERRQEVTTEGGLDVVRGTRRLEKTIGKLQGKGILVSLFTAPDARQIKRAAELEADFVELHTGEFADARSRPARSRELGRLIHAAELASSLGLQVNAGHGIRYTNLGEILQVPHLETLNIGHSIVSHALKVGLEDAVRQMIVAIRKGPRRTL